MSDVTAEREPSYMSMEDAVRELDTAVSVSIATRRTVNRMREEILRRRGHDRQEDLDVARYTPRARARALPLPGRGLDPDA